MENLQYLQPKLFSFEYKGFNYEGVAVHEYFCDAENEIDFTGNYVMILLTPDGTISTTIYPATDDFFDEDLMPDAELQHLIMTKIV